MKNNKAIVNAYLLSLCNKDSSIIKSNNSLNRLNKEINIFNNEQIYCVLIQIDEKDFSLKKIEELYKRTATFLNKNNINYRLIYDSNINIVIYVNQEKDLILINKLHIFLKTSTKIKIYIGIGNCKKRLCDVHISLSEAYEAISYRSNITEIVDINDVYTIRKSNIQISNRKNYILQLFKENKVEEIKEELFNIAEEIRKLTVVNNKKLYPTTIKRGLADIFIELINYCSSIGINVEDKLKIRNPYQRIMEINETYKIINFIYRKTLLLENEVQKKIKKEVKELIEKSLIIIEKNFANKQLDLNYVCNQIGLSPSYYSSLFNKYVGLSFREYINKIRIDESINMLLNTKYKIIEIAERCGFRSASYYISIFRKDKKTSPKAFRNSK